MQIKIKLLSDGARVPTRADDGAAGFDLYTPREYAISPGRHKLPLDIALEIPKGYVGIIKPRSGFELKGYAGCSDSECNFEHRYDCDVKDGIIDSSFRGNVSVIQRNNDSFDFYVPKHTRIAQLLIIKAEDAEFVISDELSETERGEGGFNSTGLN
jgi:dUTP pyrophosphatase